MIDAAPARAFLETAQRVAALLFRALRDSGDGGHEPTTTGLDVAVGQLHDAAAPLLAALNPAQREAVGSDQADPDD